MPRLLHPLLKILTHATHHALAAQMHYLKVENQIYRSKLSKRATVTPAEVMHHALKQLPEPLREAVNMVYLQARSLAEAAQIVGCSAQAMKSRYRRGKCLLEQHLRDLL